MIDIFTVVLPHVLMALAVWRLLHRDDLDKDPVLTESASSLPPALAAAPAPAPGKAPAKPPFRAARKPRA